MNSVRNPVKADAPASEPPTHAMNNLDALRGLAIFSVVCNHVHAYTGFQVPFFGELGGLLGVQLFFVLSGYLIIQSARRYTLSSYFIHRALRIFPSYWVVVLGLIFIFGKLDVNTIREGVTDFLWNFFAQSHWVPAALLRYDVLTVSWTLSIELAWYAMAPILIWIEPKRWSGLFWISVLVAALALSSSWVWMAQAGNLDYLYAEAIARAGVSPVNGFMRFAFIVTAFPGQLAFFIIGCILWRFEAVLTGMPSWLLCAVVVIFAGWPTAWNTLLRLNPSCASGIGLAGLFVLALKRPKLAWKWPHWLGRVSYPVYLIHVPVILAVFQQWKISGWLGACIATAIIAVASILLHVLVEQPCIALSKNLLKMMGGHGRPQGKANGLA